MSAASSNLAGKRRRITGLLELAPRNLHIVTDAGDRWVIDCDEFDADLIGRQVTVDGLLVGLDRLRVDWIGETPHAV